jgi:hypothetical protein
LLSSADAAEIEKKRNIKSRIKKRSFVVHRNHCATQALSRTMLESCFKNDNFKGSTQNLCN